MSVRYECVEVTKALVVCCYEADEHNTILYLYLIIWISFFFFFFFTLYTCYAALCGVSKTHASPSHYPENRFKSKSIQFATDLGDVCKR